MRHEIVIIHSGVDMSKESRDTIIAAVSIVISSIFIIWIVPREVVIPNYSAGVSPRLVPYISFLLIIFMSILLILSSYKKNRTCVKEALFGLHKAMAGENSLRNFRNVGAVLCISLLYYFGFIFIGFVVTSLVVLPLLTVVFGYKKYFLLSVISVCTVLLIYYSFAVFMQIYLPGWAPF
jgi:hypothetical protein